MTCSKCNALQARLRSPLLSAVPMRSCDRYPLEGRSIATTSAAADDHGECDLHRARAVAIAIDGSVHVDRSIQEFLRS